MCSSSWVHWNQKITDEKIERERKKRNRFFKIPFFFFLSLSRAALIAVILNCRTGCWKQQIQYQSLFYYLHLLLFTVFLCSSLLFVCFMDSFFSRSSIISKISCVHSSSVVSLFSTAHFNSTTTIKKNPCIICTLNLIHRERKKHRIIL